MHATEYLKKPEKHEHGPIAVLYGPERYLRQAALKALSDQVLGGGEEEDDLGLARFEGKEVELKTVCDELLTVSMWGDRRLVAVDDADPFVTQNRAGLEKYLEKPAKKSVLVLMVKSWPKNTRLAKRVTKIGLDLECASLKGAALQRWLTELCRDEHEKQLSRDAATLMIELAGNELGLLSTELDKLVAYVGDDDRIGVDEVRTLVGGWKAETTWVMVNALRDGDLGLALASLDKLLAASEAPQRILGGINFVFRKLAIATELARQGTALNTALSTAGCFPRDIADSARYLRRIGRPKAEKLFDLLLTADGEMKGSSRLAPRVQLESLLVGLNGSA